MERYALLFGAQEQKRYCQLAGEPEAMDYLARCGSDNPPRAAQVCSELLRGFDVLEGYGNQPLRERPVTVRYASVNLSRREDMPDGLRNFYALSVSGRDTESGKKAGFYDYLVLLDREELLKNGEYNYLDHLFGTYLLSSEDLNRIRRKGKLDCGKTIRKVIPTIRREDREVIYSAVEAIFAGKTLVIRLEKGMVFNTRAMELLSQIYSMLPARLAIETGFASYQDPIKIRGIMEDTGIRVFVVPAETSLEFLGVDAQVLDLNDPEQIQSTGGLLVKCMKKWVQLSWQERCDSMMVLFENVGSGIRDVQVFASVTSDFFGDPFFRYEPQPGSCGNLEALKAAFDPFRAAKYNIPWVRRKMQEKAAVMLPEGAKIAQWKAEAAAKARTAPTAEERKKYTALYRFAQKLDPSDASLYAIIQTETLVADKLNGDLEAKLARELESKEAETAAALAERDAAVQAAEKKYTAEKSAHEADNARNARELKTQKEQAEKQLREQKAKTTAEQKKAEESRKAAASASSQVESLQKRIKELTAAHQTELAKKNTAHAEELQKLKKAHSEELQKQKTAHDEELHKARAGQAVSAGTQIVALQKRIKELTEAHEAELKKLNQAHETELRQAKSGKNGSGSSKQTDALQKQIRELTEAHQAELNQLKQAHEAELKKLKDQHARELASRSAQASAASANTAAAQEVSQRAKQIIAAQLLRNLTEVEQLKARHEAELAALKAGTKN